jgi:hypothetical protein
VILYCNTPHYTTWEDAKNRCLQCNATLLDYKRDIQKYISNRSRNGIWIGLTKNAPNLTESVRKATLFKIRKCESRNIAGDFRNVSCSNKLLPSFCKRGTMNVYVLFYNCFCKTSLKNVCGSGA